MVKEKNKPFTVRFKPSYKSKIEEYKKLSKLSEAKIINEAFDEYFEGKVLNKEFIELERPYYLNTSKLFQEGKVKAGIGKPISDFNFQMIISKIPNNLDSWNEINNTYCYGENPDEHKGILLNVFYFVDIKKIEPIYLLFNYGVKKLSEDFVINTELTVSYVKPEELTIVLDKVEHKELLAELKATEINVKNDISEGLNYVDIQNKYNNINVIRWLKQEKGIINLSNSIENSIEELIEDPIEWIENDGFSKFANDLTEEFSVESETFYNDLLKEAEKEGNAEAVELLKNAVKNGNITEFIFSNLYDSAEGKVDVAKENAFKSIQEVKEGFPEETMEYFNSVINSDEVNVPILNSFFNGLADVETKEDIEAIYENIDKSSKKDKD